MILDFDSYIINESSLKKLKRQVHGALDMKSREKMRRELRDNIVTFKFKKRNGEIRTAHGTLHPSYLPKLRGGAPRPEHQMVYYDLDKNSWRSFRSYSFIKILNIKPVEIKPIGHKTHSKPIEKEEEEEIKKVTMEKEKEEVKKPIHKEEDEKEVKKPVHKKEVEDVDEDGEKHAYKSPIYDESEDEKKERKEDDEKIEKLKHKDEDEPEEKDKKEKSEGE